MSNIIRTINLKLTRYICYNTNAQNTRQTIPTKPLLKVFPEASCELNLLIGDVGVAPKGSLLGQKDP
jgi:hypothetical protein